jgi:hypothetical protein
MGSRLHVARRDLSRTDPTPASPTGEELVLIKSRIWLSSLRFLFLKLMTNYVELLDNIYTSFVPKIIASISALSKFSSARTWVT